MANDYSCMTVAELKSYAKAHGIHLSRYDKTKADIIQTISMCETNKVQGQYKNKTVAELKAFANENRIRIPSGAKKADIIEAIVSAENGDVAVADKLTKTSLVKLLQTKPGRTILKNTNRSDRFAQFKLGVYTICPHCGEEIYVYCYTEANKSPADKDSRIIEQLKMCPKCKAKLGLIQGRYIQEYIGKYDSPEYTSVFKKLKKNNDKIDSDSLRKKATQYMEKIGKKKTKSNSLNRKLSFEELKQYILYLIHMESEIYYLNERLVEVQMKELNNKRGYARAQAIISTEADKDFNLINKKTVDEIHSIKEMIAEPQKWIDEKSLVVEVDQVEPNEPVKPITKKPKVPQEPSYRKPGLFNRKKVIAENQELRKEYEKEKEKYKSALLQYENEQDAYLNKMMEFKNEYKRYKSVYKKAYSIALDKEKKRIIDENEKFLREKEECIKELSSQKKDRINEYLDMAPQKSISSLLAFEKNGIKQELKKVISARDELYSYNIIYEKYRNYVALTSLYEYLDSGRCDSLEGSEGAYNLFEAELRTNEIIVQLKTIVESLESVKANQFILYKEMKKVNKNLKIVDASLAKVINGIEELQWTASDIDRYLAEIGGTTKEILNVSAVTANNTAVTAHYSAIAAHYSHVNAELTNAMGFMIALN